MTKKDNNEGKGKKIKTKTITMAKTNIFRENTEKATQETCDISDI